MKTICRDFIKKIPKTDLHVHLDGSLRIPTLIELAKSEKVELPSFSESGLRKLVFPDKYKSLPDYLKGFSYTVAVMQNAENLERIAYELAMDNIEEGVRYVEVRFAPQLHIHDKLKMCDVLSAVVKGMNRAKQEHNARRDKDLPFEYGIILCALRWFNAHMSDYYKKLFDAMAHSRKKQVYGVASLELARGMVAIMEEENLPVVGFDLAGAEAGNPADDHKEAFQFAHSNFIQKTVHAGEAYGPESIFQAITDCYANRIGHGTHMFRTDMIQNPEIKDPEKYVNNLVKFIASRRISIEINLTSNLQTLPGMKISAHPLRQMLDEKLSASICTDNRLMSNTSVTQELILAVEHLKLNPRELRNLIAAGFKGSFYPGSYKEKRHYVRAVLDRYDQLEAEYIH